MFGVTLATVDHAAWTDSSQVESPHSAVIVENGPQAYGATRGRDRAWNIWWFLSHLPPWWWSAHSISLRGDRIDECSEQVLITPYYYGCNYSECCSLARCHIAASALNLRITTHHSVVSVFVVV
jgi:hypothetical protein